jgi:hypothetical protein
MTRTIRHKWLTGLGLPLTLTASSGGEAVTQNLWTHMAIGRGDKEVGLNTGEASELLQRFVCYVPPVHFASPQAHQRKFILVKIAHALLNLVEVGGKRLEPRRPNDAFLTADRRGARHHQASNSWIMEIIHESRWYPLMCNVIRTLEASRDESTAHPGAAKPRFVVVDSSWRRRRARMRRRPMLLGGSAPEVATRDPRVNTGGIGLTIRCVIVTRNAL